MAVQEQARRASISATTGAGLDALIDAIVEFAEQTFTLEPALVTRERQRNVLIEVAQSIRLSSGDWQSRVPARN